MGSKIGVMKIAAKRIGVEFEDYLAKVEAGEKWCHVGKHWQPVNNFHTDKSRGDGLAAICRTCRSVDDPYASLRGRISTFKGRTHTDEAKQKMSLARIGTKNRVGKKHTPESRAKMSQTKRRLGSIISGEQHHAYKDGKLVERRGLRFSTEYKRWRFDVFSRDKFTCQECGDDRGGNLNAHHIKSFATHPELRFEVSNGVTLCESCHKGKH